VDIIHDGMLKQMAQPPKKTPAPKKASAK